MTQNIAPIDLLGLAPKPAEFRLSDFPDRHFTLCRWSLRVREWASRKYGPEKLNQIFQELQIGEIADIAWYMLQEKDVFQGEFTKFLDQVVTVQDQINVVQALLGSLGIGEPEIKKIANATLNQVGIAPDPKPNRQARRKTQTGPKSSTR